MKEASGGQFVATDKLTVVERDPAQGQHGVPGSLPRQTNYGSKFRNLIGTRKQRADDPASSVGPRVFSISAEGEPKLRDPDDNTKYIVNSDVGTITREAQAVRAELDLLMPNLTPERRRKIVQSLGERGRMKLDAEREKLEEPEGCEDMPSDLTKLMTELSLRTSKFEAEKLGWTTDALPTVQNATDVPVRFDFDGFGRLTTTDALPDGLAAIRNAGSGSGIEILYDAVTFQLPSYHGLSFDADRRVLRHHEDGGSDGYSLHDLGALMKSTNEGQARIAARTLTAVLNRQACMHPLRLRAGFGLGGSFHCRCVEQMGIVSEIPLTQLVLERFIRRSRGTSMTLIAAEEGWALLAVLVSGPRVEPPVDEDKSLTAVVFEQLEADGSSRLLTGISSERSVRLPRNLSSLRRRVWHLDNGAAVNEAFRTATEELSNSRELPEARFALDDLSASLMVPENLKVYLEGRLKEGPSMDVEHGDASGDVELKRIQRMIWSRTCPSWWDDVLALIGELEDALSATRVSNDVVRTAIAAMTHSYQAWFRLQVASIPILRGHAVDWRLATSALPRHIPRLSRTSNDAKLLICHNPQLNYSLSDLSLTGPNAALLACLHKTLVSGLLTEAAEALDFYCAAIEAASSGAESEVPTPRLCPERQVSNLLHPSSLLDDVLWFQEARLKL